MNIVTAISDQRKLLLLALPMILSNITTPLLGMVDTAVIGHLEHAYYLGGIAIGSMIISILFWLAGFLRMSTTGVAAQCFGNNDREQAWRYFFHSMMIALVIAMALIVFQAPLIGGIFSLIDASDDVLFYADEYFSIRIYSAPAALTNLVFLGFFVARQEVRWVVYQLFTVNVINIALDLLFVLYFEWGVSGAALASVIADYCGSLLLFFVLLPQVKRLNWRSLIVPQRPLFSRLFSLNRDIFVRSLALQLCLAFVTVKGAELGDVTVAANAILLNLFMFASYGLDGFAYAAESLVGEAKGAGNPDSLHQVVISSAIFSGMVGIAFALILLCWGDLWIMFLTDISAVQTVAISYLPWLIIICAIGWVTFLMDGVYIGLTRSREMRNSMLLSALTFFVVWWFAQSMANHGLWLAFLCFMLMRGLSLTWDYVRLKQQLKLTA